MLFKKLLKAREIKPNEVKSIISCIKKYGLKVIKCGIDGDYKNLKEAQLLLRDLDLTRNFYIEQTNTELKLTTKWYRDFGACTFVLELDGGEFEQHNGQALFMIMSRYYKIPKIIDKPFYKDQLNDRGSFSFSTSPFVGYNEKHDGQELYNCYEYDINSAYSSIILDGIPDLNHPSKMDLGHGIKVKKGEVGFIFDDQLPIVYEGGKADIKFPLIECPKELREFVETYYNKKKTATGKERAEAKLVMNAAIGYCQRYNPFLRCYIIHKCNEKIKALIDDKTLFWNTDAIFTTEPRKDLEIGEKIGQFKEIKIKRLRYKGNNYQIDDDIPVYRGLPKEWTRRWEKENGRCYNILTDETPKRNNIYKFNMTTLKLEENK